MTSIPMAVISFPVFLMLSAVIAIILFGVLFSKNRTLAEEQLLPGEETLLELEKVRYNLVHSGRESSMHPGGRIRLTNKRLLVAQKVLLRQQWRMNVILHWGEASESGEDVSLMEMMRAGIWENNVPVEQIRLEKKSGDQWEVSIPVREGGIGPEKLTFPLNDPHEFESALQRIS